MRNINYRVEMKYSRTLVIEELHDRHTIINELFRLQALHDNTKIPYIYCTSAY